MAPLPPMATPLEYNVLWVKINFNLIWYKFVYKLSYFGTNLFIMVQMHCFPISTRGMDSYAPTSEKLEHRLGSVAH